MARPLDDGIEFFSIKTKPDKLEKALIKKFSNSGFAVYYRTLRLLAESNFGELDCSNELLHDSYAESTGVTVKEWMNILSYSANIGLFDKNKWEKHKLLVSSDITEQLARILKTRESARFRMWRKRNPDAPLSDYSSPNIGEPLRERDKDNDIHSNRDSENEKPSKRDSAFKGKKIGEIVEDINL